MASAIKREDQGPDRIGKTLPSEVTGLYLSIRALFINIQNADTFYVLLLMAALSLAVSLVYIWRVRGVTNPAHIVIYAFGFVLWACSLDVESITMHVGEQLKPFLGPIVTALTLIWSIAVPALTPTDKVISNGAT